MCFLWIEWTDCTIFFNSDISFASLLAVYLINFLKRSPFKRVFVIFFICMPASKERPVRVVSSNQLFLRGREVKATVFRTAHIVWLWFWVVRGQVKSNCEVGEDLIKDADFVVFAEWYSNRRDQNLPMVLREAAVALSTKDVDFVVLAEWYSKRRGQNLQWR